MGQILLQGKRRYKVLIAGAGSYIGTALEQALKKKPGQYGIAVLDLEDSQWRTYPLEGYDSVVLVAGLAHRREKRGELALYRSVNTRLPIELAKKAKRAGIKQFIFLSSMSVYGKQRGRIGKEEAPNPASYYGRTKWEAEQGLRKLESPSFRVAVLRPPMVYGKGCKGNYPRLRALALKTPLFPAYPNYRSMLYIGNLTAVLEQLIQSGTGGLYFPQNSEYVSTKRMVEEIAACHGKRMRFVRFLSPLLRLLEQRMPLVQKVFGDLAYTQEMNVDRSWLPYQDFAETIRLTEGETGK